jgi:hypothetical protein
MSHPLKPVVAAGTRRFLHSPVSWLLGLLGAGYGFFFFCYPELRIASEAPPGWQPFWAASGAPTWLVCTLVTLVNAAAPLLVLWLAFLVSACSRGRAARGAPVDRSVS